MHTILIPSDKIDLFNTRVASLVRRANRAGAPVPVVRRLGECTAISKLYDRVTTVGFGGTFGMGRDLLSVRHVPAVAFDVDLPEVAIPGWSYLGVIVQSDNGGPALLLGRDIPARFHTASQECEHCGVNRFRLHTYVVRNKTTGECKQVGSTCLNEFTGSPRALALVALQVAWEELVREVDAGLEGDGLFSMGGSGGGGCTTGSYVATAMRVIDANGFVSAKTAEERDVASTRMLTDMAINGERVKLAPETEDLTARAEAILAWGASLAVSGASEFDMNLAAACGNTYARFGKGLLAYLPIAYARAHAPVAPKSSVYLGRVGEKLNVRGKLVMRRTFDTIYGVSTILKFDVEGAAVVWKASSLQLTDADVGATFDVQGGVKAHSEYNGECQTTVQRAKLRKV